MAGAITPRKTELGWIMDIPPEMASLIKVAPGSLAILFPKEGRLDIEILPPPPLSSISCMNQIPIGKFLLDYLRVPQGLLNERLLSLLRDA